MWYIKTCPALGYKIEYRTAMDECCISRAAFDVFNNPIKDIDCYKINKKPNGEYTIKVDKNKWMDNLANGTYNPK